MSCAISHSFQLCDLVSSRLFVRKSALIYYFADTHRCNHSTINLHPVNCWHNRMFTLSHVYNVACKHIYWILSCEYLVNMPICQLVFKLVKETWSLVKVGGSNIDWPHLPLFQSWSYLMVAIGWAGFTVYFILDAIAACQGWTCWRNACGFLAAGAFQTTRECHWDWSFPALFVTWKDLIW